MLAQLITLANNGKIISNNKHLQEQLHEDVPEKQLSLCEFYSLISHSDQKVVAF